MKCKLVMAAIALLFAPSVTAVTFLEDFESYNSFAIVPDPIGQDYYEYSDPSDIGNVTNSQPILDKSNSLRIISNSTDISSNVVTFDLVTPNQLTDVTFVMQGSTTANSTLGSKQVVDLASSFPVRSIVQFFMFCRNDTGNVSYDDACQLNVRWQEAESTGVELIPYNATTNRFNITVSLDWQNVEFCLTVNAVDDGCFPFYQLPNDYARLRMFQFQPDIPMNMTFDYWQVVGAVDVASGVVEGDVAQGVQDFATDMHFTSATSLFVFGIILFVILNTALIAAMFAHGKNNTIAPAAAFFAIIVSIWLVQMEFWPDWIIVVFIIYVSSMVGLILRRVMIGIRDTSSSGPSLVIGSLGYFVICATFLAMAGYQTAEISIPTGSTEEEGATDQSFGEATLECVITLFSDCSQQTESQIWKTITDIFGWIIASVQYLFQLMTFQLPIPVVLNIIIVLPPAAALGAYAVQLIRG